MSKRKITADKILRAQISNYLLENDVKKGEPGRYLKIAQEYGTTSQIVRRCHRTLIEAGLMENVKYNSDVFSTSSFDLGKTGNSNTVINIEGIKDTTFKENTKTGEADYTFITKTRIKTLEDLIEACDIDLTSWDIVSYEVNKWEVGRKDKSVEWQVKKGAVKYGDITDSGKIFVEPLFQVKAKLQKKKIETDLGLQKEAVLAELRAYSPIVKSSFDFASENKSYLLEICIHDLHLGSLAWKPEAGDDYDIKIAEARFKKSISELLKRVNLNNVERILFPIGNDFFNIDNKNNSTVNGTVIDTDVRFIKMIKVAKRIVIETIDELSHIAPIDIVLVPGNHDFTISLVFGEILDAFYFNNEKVTVNTSPFPRKYYQYGSVGIQFSHGDQENHQALGLIFATEQSRLWADTKFRYCQLGHFHKNKKINYVSVDEHQGFQVQILPTLSSTTAWAAAKGYSSLRQAKAFLYHKKEGLQGEFTYTV